MSQEINVNVRQGDPTFWSLFGLALIVAFIIQYWQVFLLITAFVVAVYLGFRLRNSMTTADMDRYRQRRRLMSAADRQHNLTMQGDPRGTYGLDWKAPDERSR